MGKTVIIFPLSFPYSSGQENSFLQNEVTELCKKFEKVIIIPSQIGIEKQILDNKVHIESSFAKHNKAKRTKKTLSCFRNISILKLLILEVFLNPKILLSYKHIKLVLNDLFDVSHKYLWINNYFKNNFYDEPILYSYWFTSTTTALCLAKGKYKTFKVITRAHGIDLYKVQNFYYPFRKFALKHIDKVILVSLAAQEYMINEYPEHKSKFALHRLGVLNHSFTNSINKNEFNIVSCSSLIPVKRVDLLTKGILKFAKQKNNVKVNWHHFGDGYLLSSVNALLESKTENLNVKKYGHVNNDVVLDFYKSNPVNVFITTSLSEGGCPVSIQEAYSFGIPAIGTAVGGIPEIIDNENGVLLSENPKEEEIVKALEDFYENDERILKKREASKRKYENFFNADKNFKEFVSILENI